MKSTIFGWVPIDSSKVDEINCEENEFLLKLLITKISLNVENIKYSQSCDKHLMTFNEKEKEKENTYIKKMLMFEPEYKNLDKALKLKKEDHLLSDLFQVYLALKVNNKGWLRNSVHNILTLSINKSAMDLFVNELQLEDVKKIINKISILVKEISKEKISSEYLKAIKYKIHRQIEIGLNLDLVKDLKVNYSKSEIEKLFKESRYSSLLTPLLLQILVEKEEWLLFTKVMKQEKTITFLKENFYSGAENISIFLPSEESLRKYYFKSVDRKLNSHLLRDNFFAQRLLSHNIFFTKYKKNRKVKPSFKIKRKYYLEYLKRNPKSKFAIVNLYNLGDRKIEYLKDL